MRRGIDTGTLALLAFVDSFTQLRGARYSAHPFRSTSTIYVIIATLAGIARIPVPGSWALRSLTPATECVVVERCVAAKLPKLASILPASRQ